MCALFHSEVHVIKKRIGGAKEKYRSIILGFIQYQWVNQYFL